MRAQSLLDEKTNKKGIAVLNKENIVISFSSFSHDNDLDFHLKFYENKKLTTRIIDWKTAHHSMVNEIPISID